MAATTPNASFRLPMRWLTWAALGLTVAVFVSQLSFFLGWGMGIVRPYVLHHAWILVWLLAVTTLTRTVPLRLLVAFWFVGVYATMAVVLFVGGPIASLFGLGNALIPGFVLPLIEELAKPMAVLLFFWYMTRRRRWQPGASDGLVLGFVLGAGFAFHEDMMFGRVWGSGLGGTPFSGLFPTISYFRGSLSAYHDVWAALVGLSIGAAFLLQARTRFAWALPVAAWLVVFTDHWTGNYLFNASAGDAIYGVADTLRGLVLDGSLTVILLIVGIVGAIAGELAILRSTSRPDRLFASAGPGALLQALRGLPRGEWRRLQALREYTRRRRAAYYAIWARRPRRIEQAAVAEMGADLYGLAEAAQVQLGHDGPAPLPGAVERDPAPGGPSTGGS